MSPDKLHPLPPGLQSARPQLRRGQRLGKYRVLKRLGEGGFAEVYSAQDTVEGVKVALKVPRGPLLKDDSFESFYREIRLAARLHHPHILGLKNADFIDGRFVAVSALGVETLAHRLTRRLATSQALDFADQILSAVAFAHEKKIIHCDIKPENVILFEGGVARLTDFGIAKLAMRTISGSGSGTVGYVAPEQAMGRPSRRSDVFSLGLVLYRMLAGELPRWPFDWPPKGIERVRRKIPQRLIDVLAKALEVDPRRRFPDARRMLEAFRRARRATPEPKGSVRASKSNSKNNGKPEPGWRTVQRREFKRRLGRALETRHDCSRCGGPVSEAMTTCPWCGGARKVHRGGTRFPAHCPRCRRGMKLDWRFCPWCYGAGFEVHGRRTYTDRRYAGRCDNVGCSRRQLMPFMRYCPWCRRKVRRVWKIKGEKSSCAKCGWGIAAEYWSFCPWCSQPTGKP